MDKQTCQYKRLSDFELEEIIRIQKRILDRLQELKDDCNQQGRG